MGSPYVKKLAVQLGPPLRAAGEEAHDRVADSTAARSRSSPSRSPSTPAFASGSSV